MHIQDMLNNKLMRNSILFCIALFTVATIFSQEPLKSPKKQHQLSFGVMDYMSIQMPLNENGNPEINMGVTGIHYNLWLNKSFYTGLGFYGAVNGKRGGMFTLGINAGVQKALTKKLFLDAGIHIGGGGGANTPDGGGAFLLPHVNIGYQFKNFATTLGYSHINFFDKGNINNSQFRLGIQLPLSFEHASFADKEKVFSTKEIQNSAWNQSSKRISMMLHVNTLSPYGVSLKGKTIRLAGFEFDNYFSKHWFAFFKADGAFHGIRGGYMDLFLGGGYHFSMNKNRTNILAKFGLGAGGGGGADTGGGFLIYPDLSIEQKLYKNTYVSINKGYLMNPNNDFSSTTFGLGLKYYIDHSGIPNTNNTSTKYLFKGLEIIVGQEMYMDAKRMSQPAQDLHQIALQFNAFISKNIYVAGHTSFANFGDAGAYAEGLVGLGYQTKPLINNNIEFFTQIVAGASGGGGISTGQGLIFKPAIGLNYKITETLKLRTSLGKVKANEGGLSSTSITLGLNYNLAFLTAN